MTYLDEDALAAVRTITRERKLSTSERLAIYAFAQRGVPAKVMARTFSVSQNAIRYIANPTRQGAIAHEAIKAEYERLGEERVWNSVITNEQIESINDGLRKMYEGKKLDDSGYRRINRRGPRARRARATSELPETGSDETGGSPETN